MSVGGLIGGPAPSAHVLGHQILYGLETSYVTTSAVAGIGDPRIHGADASTGAIAQGFGCLRRRRLDHDLVRRLPPLRPRLESDRGGLQGGATFARWRHAVRSVHSGADRSGGDDPVGSQDERTRVVISDVERRARDTTERQRTACLKAHGLW